MTTREELDSIGLMEVPQKTYYGAQPLRAKNNFHITGRSLHLEFIKNLARIKKTTTFTNMTVHMLDERTSNAIVRACDEIIGGKPHPQFTVDAVQGGTDTSANMNANKVITSRAIEILGGEKGDYSTMHPNDHVDVAQSTNDMMSCTGKLIILGLLPGLTDELDRLQKALHQKSIEFGGVVRVGRTQLQDVVPIRLGRSSEAHTTVIGRDIRRIRKQMDELKYLSIGTTVVGITINVNPAYLLHIIRNVNLVCGTDYVQVDDLFDAAQNLDCFVHTSSVLHIRAVSLSKMRNGLRLLSSDPRVGLGETNLPPKQDGSFIMPGKTNPITSEVVPQVASNVIGSNVTVTVAARAGQMELNTFEPVIFYKIFEFINTTRGAMETLIDSCTLGTTASRKHCRKLVGLNVVLAAALYPALGYKRSAEIAEHSMETGIPVRRSVLEEGLMIEAQLD